MINPPRDFDHKPGAIYPECSCVSCTHDNRMTAREFLGWDVYDADMGLVPIQSNIPSNVEEDATPVGHYLYEDCDGSDPWEKAREEFWA